MTGYYDPETQVRTVEVDDDGLCESMPKHDTAEITVDGSVIRKKIVVMGEVYNKIMALTEAMGDSEAGGLLICSISPKEIIVEDVIVPEQSATPGSVNMSAEEVAKILEPYMITKPEIWLKAKGWWHSHGSGATFWSCIDDANITRLLSTITPFLSIVTNTEGHMRVRLDNKCTFPLNVTEPDPSIITETKTTKTNITKAKKSKEPVKPVNEELTVSIDNIKPEVRNRYSEKAAEWARSQAKKVKNQIKEVRRSGWNDSHWSDGYFWDSNLQSWVPFGNTSTKHPSTKSQERMTEFDYWNDGWKMDVELAVTMNTEPKHVKDWSKTAKFPSSYADLGERHKLVFRIISCNNQFGKKKMKRLISKLLEYGKQLDSVRNNKLKRHNKPFGLIQMFHRGSDDDEPEEFENEQDFRRGSRRSRMDLYE